MSAATTEAATTSLHDAVHEAMRNLPQAIQGIKDARAASTWGNGIIQEMQATIGLIVALEAASDVIAETHKAVRSALAASMSDTGAPAIQTEFHTATLKAGARRVVIIGEVPDEMLKPPEPQKPRPDLDAIKAALKSGPLPYAYLSNGGEQTLAITTRRQS